MMLINGDEYQQDPNHVFNFTNYIPEVDDSLELSGYCTHYLIIFF